MRTLILALALTGCAPGGPWIVTGLNAKDTADARAMIATAQRLHPTTPVKHRREVKFLPDLTAICGKHTSGCAGQTVFVLWPHPKCPANADISCSALGHEICHVVNHNFTERETDECNEVVIEEWRNSVGR